MGHINIFNCMFKFASEKLKINVHNDNLCKYINTYYGNVLSLLLYKMNDRALLDQFQIRTNAITAQRIQKLTSCDS